MTRLFEFSLHRPGLGSVRFLIARDALPCNGDVESLFLDGLSDLQRHPGTAPLGSVLTQVAQSWDRIVVVRNPDLVLDAELPGRIATALRSLDPVGPWALAGAGGLGLADRRHLALYASENPAIPEYAGLQPLIDLMPDLYIVNGAYLRDLPPARIARLDAALEPALATQGYLDGHVSVFAPDLTAGINGGLMPRDFVRVTAEMGTAFGDRLSGRTLATLSGPVRLDATQIGKPPAEPACDLDEIIGSVVAERCDAPAISIVTRTRFQRPHLLRRMLASISRARCTRTPLEVILSTDLDEALATEAFECLQRDHVNLDLKLRLNPAVGHSRVTNLMGGVAAATGDYVLFLDDDDYIDLFAFDAIRPAFFAGNRPVLTLTSEVHEETWEETPSGRWVLSHSMQISGYPATGWRRMFSGVNKLPICGMLIPRACLQARLETCVLRHDLSEDYALFLLLLTSPDLPAIHECAEPVAHISMRGSENSVLMRDRRPWVQDIARFLSELTQAAPVAGPGLWSLLAERDHPEPEQPTQSTVEFQQQLTRRNQEIAMLRQELAHLRASVDPARESAA